MQRLVILGGDAAGMSAATQVRRRRDESELEIVVLERGPYTSYSACGIPYWIAGDVGNRDDLVVRTPVEFQKSGIRVRTGTEATVIDPDARQVWAGGDSLEFDQLLIATGAVPVRPDIPGIDLLNVFGVQTLQDGQAVIDALEERPRRAVVIGGGYIGLEMAEALLRRGLEVTLLEAAEQPMSTVDPDMGAEISKAVRDMGIDVRLQSKAVRLDGDEKVASVVTDSDEHPADVVILGLGVRPNGTMAQAAGIACGTSGGISVDRRMRSRSHDFVWAAGDCVESRHRISGRDVNIALGTHANKQGRVAGINIGGGYATFGGVVGTAVTKVCALEIARTGLSTKEAVREGFAPVSAVVDSTTRAGYFPGAEPIRTKVIAERGTGRLLGAQIVGKEGAAKRIDVFATALWNEMRVDDFAGMDLSYAPPFAPTWDPVLIAARKAAAAVEQAAQE